VLLRQPLLVAGVLAILTLLQPAFSTQSHFLARNLTQWIAKAAAFSEHNRCDAMMLQEHRQANEGFDKMNMTMRHNGWKAMGLLRLSLVQLSMRRLAAWNLF
jgi:hypothetical protein